MVKKLSSAILFYIIFIAVCYADIPSSRRSTEVIKRISPVILTDLSKQNLKLGSPVYLRIFKESQELEVWLSDKNAFKLYKKYPICYFSGALGPKLAQGDGQSPEGFYSFKPSQLNPYSSYHLAFNIGYPNAYDKANGRTGSAIMVHGNCVSIGCYAMTDQYIDEIYTIVHEAFKNGQQSISIHIFPFYLTQENLNAQKKSEWISFWSNLKDGFDLFEKNKIPPQVSVNNKQYVFKEDNL